MELFKNKAINFALDLLMVLITISNKQNQQQLFSKHFKNQPNLPKTKKYQNNKKMKKK